ncbi:hypothetical protein CAP31_01495 [Sulfuriferula sp. AH1]|uniref:DUF971 domain-containing protein n=1 Tax=Sulfuriferula sp. AH1 TaxID=1985873 RepID=UPI000B554164|nr:DUF971 domain-containing protein [Sulfuriferula sp. AH1]ARU30482.1 hypothetical protein CAP31_01495 [Sulfuriferula sp. AH1]
MPNDFAPAEIRQLPASGALEIKWNDGLVSHLKDAELRRACRCTTCRQLTDKMLPIPCPEAISILSIVPVGSYAIQISFNDGHDRGIFPWEYLRQLGGGK